MVLYLLKTTASFARDHQQELRHDFIDRPQGSMKGFRQCNCQQHSNYKNTLQNTTKSFACTQTQTCFNALKIQQITTTAMETQTNDKCEQEMVVPASISASATTNKCT